MRIVEVRSERAAFPRTLGAMREWLDRNGRPLVRFETATDDSSGIITVDVQFDSDDLAELFRQSFEGSYARQPELPETIKSSQLNRAGGDLIHSEPTSET